jgi:hypothetical protein
MCAAICMYACMYACVCDRQEGDLRLLHRLRFADGKTFGAFHLGSIVQGRTHSNLEEMHLGLGCLWIRIARIAQQIAFTESFDFTTFNSPIDHTHTHTFLPQMNTVHRGTCPQICRGMQFTVCTFADEHSSQSADL